MKKILILFLILTFSLSLTSCHKKDKNTSENTKETITEELENTKEENTKEEVKTDEEVKTEESETTEEENTTEETETTEEEIIPVELNISDALKLCQTMPLSYKENYDYTKKVQISGKVIADFAIGSYHFMIIADSTGLIPVSVNSVGDVLKKWTVGNTYTLEGYPGVYRNNYSLRAEFKNKYRPTEIADLKLNFDDYATNSTIENVYNKAYEIEFTDNHSNIDPTILKVTGTYLAKINSNLMIVFDGTKHLILHGEDNFMGGLSLYNNYDFYVMPSVSTGKKSAEYVGNNSSFGYKDLETLKQEIKAAAITGDIDKLSQVNRYEDNKVLYPNIFKSNCYVSSNNIDSKDHYAFVSDLENNPVYSTVNERPLAIYAKNHVYSGYNTLLTPYYNNSKSGEFYYVITEYQSSYHVFHAFVFDILVEELVLN